MNKHLLYQGWHRINWIIATFSHARFKCMRDYKQTFEMDWFLRDGPATLPKGLLQITL
uniref:Uncharacterized protein n=2 Tax=Anguilla anguilla TaxID=7936 RepID=A0A0E9QNE5_ANGAN